MEKKKDSLSNMLGAIRKSILIGKTLQDISEKLIKLYKNGSTYQEIAETLGVKESYQVTSSVAKSAVGYAIRGYSGGLVIKPYSGLIDEKELSVLRKKHKLEGSVRGGRKSGISQSKKHSGMFTLTKSERKKIAYEWVLSRNQVPWTDKITANNRTAPSELEYAVSLYNSQEFRSNINCQGRSKGSPIWEDIVFEVNKKYHKGKNVRTLKAVSQAVYSFVKKLK
ncbi:MAG: hypothetical protein AABX73_00965 [Nanoarchaeota archaeon]